MALPKILLVTSELFPEFGYPTAGGGVRAQQLYRSLQEEGFPVDLALARQSSEDKDLPEWATRFLYRPEFLDGLIEQADPDVILGEGWEPLSHVGAEDTRLFIADCPGPLVLEHQHRGVGDLRANVHHKVRTLARMDAVLCPNDPMRYYLSGYLTLAGWKPEDSDRILRVPIGLPPDLPARKAPDSNGPIVFVGGVSWAWHGSSDWLLDLAAELEKRDLGVLRIRMGKHPHHRLLGEVYETLPPKLLEHPRVSAGELTDWETLVAELAQTPLAMEWSPKHLEREIASTLRIVTYLWCGVPVIVRPHLDLAKEIHEYGAGWVVDDWDETIGILETVKTNPGELESRSRAATRLARERHTWPEAHKDLSSLLKAATPRRKTGSFLDRSAKVFESQEAEIHRLGSENEFLKKETERFRKLQEEAQADAESFRSLRQKLPYKIWKRIAG
jgi:hypothetical protein